MKLTLFNGLARDLADHLVNELSWGQFKDGAPKEESNVLQRGNAFEKYCADFVSDRVPEKFDFTRVTSIHVAVVRKPTLKNAFVKIVVDGKTFSGKQLTLLS
tara:strand:+ start:2643 stop:2948 length:306 start_codon:yes stop_codon:yes gene_type:complete